MRYGEGVNRLSHPFFNHVSVHFFCLLTRWRKSFSLKFIPDPLPPPPPPPELTKVLGDTYIKVSTADGFIIF